MIQGRRGSEYQENKFENDDKNVKERKSKYRKQIGIRKTVCWNYLRKIRIQGGAFSAKSRHGSDAFSSVLGRRISQLLHTNIRGN